MSSIQKAERKQFPAIEVELCGQCGGLIRVQIYKGSGVCSENCRKDRDNDHAPFVPVNIKV